MFIMSNLYVIITMVIIILFLISAIMSVVYDKMIYKMSAIILFLLSILALLTIYIRVWDIIEGGLRIIG